MPKNLSETMVETKKFVGWSTNIVPIRQEVSTLSDGLEVFQEEVVSGLSIDIDVYQVTLFYGGTVSRQITFQDRMEARRD